MLSAIAACGLGLIVLGFAVGRSDDQRAKPADPAIEKLIPAPNDLVLRQQEVGIDLAPGYTGVLIIDGQEIGTYDILSNPTPIGGTAPAVVDARFDPNNGTLLFAPRVGSTIEKFTAGDHRITAIYWRIGETRDQGKIYTWSFKVN